MPFNGSGIFNLYTPGNPSVSGGTIYAAWANNTLGDIATGLSSVLTLNGQSAMTGPLLIATGSSSAPGIGFNAENTTGIYQPGAGQLSIVTQGAISGAFTTTGFSAFNLNVTGSTVPVNGLYLPSSNTLGLALNTTAVGSLTASVLTVPAVAVTGSTVPANGIYLPAANTLGFATNTLEVGSINATGNWSLSAPTSGVGFTATGFLGSSTAVFVSGNAATTNVADVTIERAGSTINSAGEGPSLYLYDTTNSTGTVLQNSGGQTELWQYNSAWAQVLKVTTTGQIITTAPSSTGGVGLEINPGNNYGLIVSAPTADYPALVASGASGGYAANFQGNATTNESFGVAINGGTSTSDKALIVQNAAGTKQFLGIDGTGQATFSSSSGNTLTVNGSSNAYAMEVQSGLTSGQAYGLRVFGGTTAADYAFVVSNSNSSANLMLINGVGGVSFPNGYTSAGPNVTIPDGSGTAQTVGYQNLPSRGITSNYTTVMDDSGKMIGVGASSLTVTIASNASVAYPLGTVITIVTGSAAVTIAISSDNLYLAGTGGGTSGTRTLGAYAIASALKIGATTWLISGAGLS